MGIVIPECDIIIHMANGQSIININSADNLASELAYIGKAMLNLSKKIEKLNRLKKVKEVKVTPETDPEMFTQEFINAVRKSRQDIAKGKVYDYFEIRKTLDLE